MHTQTQDSKNYTVFYKCI